MWDKHQKFVLESLKKPLSSEELNTLLAAHREKLINLQHERLVHLIVTMTVALCTTILTSLVIFTQILILLIADLLLALLLVAYLIHYRRLENTTQYWYELTDQIKKLL